MHHSMRVQLVKLTADGYSTAKGTLGVVESSAEDGERHFVAWAGAEPYSSGPIAEQDLELLGWVSVRVSDDVEERMKLADLKDPAAIARAALRKAIDLVEVP